MKAGIIGSRGSGKSTLFHALTGLAPTAGHPEGRSRERLGQLTAADPRLDLIQTAYGSRKKVPVEMTVIDFAPEPKEQKAGAVFEPSAVPLIRELDALVIVIPQFASNAAELAPTLEHIEGELVFADFDHIERRLERMKKERKGSDFERRTLEKCGACLEQGRPLRLLDLNAQERQSLSSFALLSLKPAVLVLNCEGERIAAEIIDSERTAADAHGLQVVRVAAAFEAELCELEPEARRELLGEAGLDAPASDRLIAALYRCLGLITFYTANEAEAHAWPLMRGATALEAAARVHTDLAKGFIRAEVIRFDDLRALHSAAQAKDAGKLQVEGRDYVVQDGDIIRVRFKV